MHHSLGCSFSGLILWLSPSVCSGSCRVARDGRLAADRHIDGRVRHVPSVDSFCPKVLAVHSFPVFCDPTGIGIFFF